jgi:hypothetical protein
MKPHTAKIHDFLVDFYWLPFAEVEMFLDNRYVPCAIM